MASIRIAYGLPFVSASVQVNRQSITLDWVLLDTGSAATVFSSEELEKIDFRVGSDDTVEFMFGIGGREAVVEKQVDAVLVGDLIASPLTIQIGGMNYGFPIDGILGLDFLLQTGAIIDLKQLEIHRA